MKREVRLSISGMMCAGCVAAVEKAIADVAGVDEAVVNLGERTATLQGDMELEAVIGAVRDAGFDAAELVSMADETDREQQQQLEYRRLWKQAVISGVAGFGLFLMMLTGVLPGVEQARLLWFMIGLLTLAIMIRVGGHFYQGALVALKNRRGNMDTLVALGTGAAWLYSMAMVLFPDVFPGLARHAYFEAAIIIIALVSLGSALEMRARGRTTSAIRHLVGLQPLNACVIRNGKEIQVALEEVGLDESLRIRPGEKIPVDGVILEGESYLQEAMLTGESEAVFKHAGDDVFAGTINVSGTFLMKSTHIGRDTVLAHIIDMVRQAQSNKPAIARLVDQVAAVFVPVVVGIAIISFLVWLNWGPSPAISYAVVAAMTVLVIACPCALGLATPISIMVSVGRAAENGILIRQGDALQQVGKATAIVLDKTGTLTEGKPSLESIHTLASFDENRSLQLAYAIESVSEHPLAQAIREEAVSRGLTPPEITGFSTVSGLGVRGKVDGRDVLLGNAAMMKNQDVDINLTELLAEPAVLPAATHVFLAVDGQLVAVFSIRDPLRSDSFAAIKRYHAMGLKVVMLTGDNQQVAASIAEQSDIDEVHANLMPGDKVDIVKQLQQQGEVVVMVGDGINDAPALAQADVGIAIGTGTDIAVESADIVLMQASLPKVADTIALSRATLRNIKQNLAGAFVYNSLGIPVAAGLLYPFTGMLLSPVIAAAAMSLSSVTVVSNALRLKKLDLQNYE